MAKTNRKTVIRGNSADRAQRQPSRRVAPPPQQTIRPIDQTRKGTVRLPLYFGWEIIVSLQRLGQRFISPFKTRRRGLLTVASAIVALVIIVAVWGNGTLRAASYTWIQNTWAGGQTANTATHPGDQSSWDEYNVKDASVTAGAAVALTPVSGSFAATTDAEFNLGGTAWYDAAWGFRKPVTIDSSVVSGGASLTNFPVLVSIASDTELRHTGSGGNVGKIDGTDIVFTAADGVTKLSHEVETYVPTTGQLVAWVEIPTLSNVTDTTLNLYYGNAGAADQQDTANVWDADYHGVWHLDETSGTRADSTAKANTLSDDGVVTSNTGKVGTAALFDNTATQCLFRANADLNADFPGKVASSTAVTASVWINLDSEDVTHTHNIMTKYGISGPDKYFFYQNESDDLLHAFSNSTASSASLINPSTWYYATFVYSGSTIQLYVNGVADGAPVAAGSFLGNGSNFVLGSRGACDSSSRSVSGLLDEARISSVARSIGWIATEYNNQFAPATYQTVGSQKAYVAGGSNTVVTGTGSAGSVTLTLSGATYNSPGTYQSQALDTTSGGTWGAVTYTSTLPANTTLIVKVRSGNNADLSDATAFGSCTAITSGQLASTGGCVTDGHRYVQYQATLTTSDTAVTPELNDISISYTTGASGSLTSSPYNAGDAANVLASVAWSNSGTGTAQFQIRTSPDGAAWTSWLGPTGTGDYYTSAVGGDTINVTHRDGTNDQYFQYRVDLTSTSPGDPITVSQINLTYVVNAPPEFQAAPTAVQNSDGTVTVAYSVRDSDTNSGTLDPGFVTPSFEYSINNGSNWSPITLGLPAGATDHKAVQQVNYSDYTMVWNAKAQLNGTYAAQAMVRVTLDDLEAANNTVVGTTVAYALDVKNPTLGSPALTVNASTSPATLVLNASDDSSLEMCITLDNTQSNCVAYNANATLALATDPDTVYAIFRDAKNNTSSTSAVSPPTPTSMFIRDISNPPTNEYQLFVAWSVTSLSVGQFTSYNVYHSTDGSSYSPLATITDKDINYYFHPGLTLNTTHYYKVSTTASTGSTSYFSNTVTETANGQGGGSDLVGPFLSNIAIGSVTTQSATVTWDTDELSNSTVGYSTTAGNFATEVGVGSMVDNASGIGQHSVTLTGLTPNTTYYVRASSTDPSGNTGSDNNGGNGYSFTTISGPVISNVTPSSIANTTAIITWNTNVAADSTVTYSTSSALTSPTTVTDATSTTAHAVTLTGLTIGTRYYFKVASDVATDTNGGQYYSFVTTADTAAPVITSITINPITDTQAVVTWTTDEKSTSDLAYGNTSGTYPLSAPTNASLNFNHAVTLSNLTANTTYYFTVSSTDASGNAATSSEQNFTTLEKLTTQTDLQKLIDEAKATSSDATAPVITNVAATAVTDQTATVTWTTNEDANSFVQFGPSDDDQIIFGNWVYGQTHEIALRNLTPLTTYHFLVISADRAGNVAQSGFIDFTTTAITAENLEAELEEQQAAIEGSAATLPPPVISGQPRVDVTATTAVFSWTTDKNANSLLSYATETDFLVDGQYSQTVGLPDTYALSHSITLTNLTPSTVYHYQIRSKTKLGQEAKTNDLTFQTTKRIFAIENYSVDALDEATASFRWTTTEAATATVQIAPYRNNVRAVEELKTVVDSTSTLIHQITIPDLEPAVRYDVELISVNVAGERVSRTIDAFSTTNTNLPPVITNLRVDSALSPGEKVKVQTIVSWNTNTLATSQVLYREGIGRAGEELPNKTGTDPVFKKRHVVVLTTLSPGAVYQLVARSADSNGQSTDSKSISFLTPQQQQSVFQVILNTFQQTFGWTNLFN